MSDLMELRIEYLTLDKLKPYEKNARKHQDTDKHHLEIKRS